MSVNQPNVPKRMEVIIKILSTVVSLCKIIPHKEKIGN